MGFNLLFRPAAIFAAMVMPTATLAQGIVAKPAGFAMCAICHKTSASEKSILAPNLFGVGGRTAGSQPGFTYSAAMKNAKFTWTRDKLVAFITKPSAVVPGTRMAFGGQSDPKQAVAVADYLLSLK